MDDSKSEGATAPSQAYAAALREAMAGYLAAGGTQKAIADAILVAPSTLSRYLSGDRLLPPEDLPRMRSALAERGHPLNEQAYARLESLRKAAYAASGSSAAQLTWIQSELDRLTAEHKRSHQIAETRLAELEEKAGRLTGQLEQALDRIEKQNKSLQHAGNYARQVEAELVEQREQARILRQEVEVLRGQNRLLIEEQAGTVPGVSPQVSPAELALVIQHNETQRRAESSPAPDGPGSPHTTPTSGPVAVDPPPYPPTVHQPGLLCGGLPVPLDPEPEVSRPWFGYSCVALMTYLSWVLWLTFMTALKAVPGPGISAVIVTLLIALVCPLFILGLITKLLRMGDELEIKLQCMLLVAQAITFAGWLASVIGPVFTVLGVETAATWIADEILL
ncbi:hypothetical protein [Streptomyces sp. NPDC088757]|uniref:hypothetical protein n=1 Tax=Streptomyces sp. NPDC088757 TaxID=3365889 RepID=UPI00381C2B5C